MKKSINLSNNTGDSYFPKVSSSGNNVYVTWIDDTPLGRGDILIVRSTDNGKTFEKAINLSNNTGNSLYQTVFIK